MSQAGWMAMQGFGRVSDRVAQLGEQRKAEAQKAGALRKYLSVVDPNNKDTYTTAGLPDLEGAMMAHAQQQQQQQEELRQAEMRQMMTARALQIQQQQNQMAQQAGFENLLRQATAGPMAQDATPQNLLRAATQYPGANINPVLMQAIENEQSNAVAGMPLILPGPFPNTKVVTDARGRGTPQIMVDPNLKIDAASQLSPSVALKAYNDNQARITQLRQQLQFAKSDPKNAALLDTAALESEIKEMESQQPALKARFGGAAQESMTKLPTARNPRTGEVIVYKNGRWQPLKP